MRPQSMKRKNPPESVGGFFQAGEKLPEKDYEKKMTKNGTAPDKSDKIDSGEIFRLFLSCFSAERKEMSDPDGQTGMLACCPHGKCQEFFLVPRKEKQGKVP